MKELTDTEIQWLEAFIKNHEFFASFLFHYKMMNSLSNNQYHWPHFYINQTEENGNSLLSAEEIKFLEENSENKEKLREWLEIYEDKEYLENVNYNEFLDLKVEMTGKTEDCIPKESFLKHKVVRIF